MENKIIDVNNILFRCSSLGYIMTEAKGSITEIQLAELKILEEKENLTHAQSKKYAELIAKRDAPPKLSDTTVVHLVDKYVSVKYGRETDIITKYTNKGLSVEEDSLTLYSRYKKRNYTKNQETLSNEFISGTPDVIKEHIIDIKSSWDIFTFFRTKAKDINKMYYWQMQGYMALTGAKSATLAYCLTDTPDHMINDEKRRLLWKMGALTENDPLYIEGAEKLEANLRYEDIPLEERIIEVEIERNEEDIHRIYQRVMQCREYMAIYLFKTEALKTI